ncbi:Arc family DNA-binding protein [Cronobacter malonaticus]|uniref:Arc family DNA-binding protein n=1 Tax=Cronobacter malonaticus TaxID=413503 RepID=UPI000CFE07AA|nr:Arc family DNA-binding protein [Cronobacter malonaticus]NCH31177.1 Arc family DNA-binding protein [Cronobacter malonaticus]
MAEKQVKDYDKFNLRFPDGMRDAIAERAKRNGRSMNSEIVQILQDALDADVSAIDKSELEGVSFIHADESGAVEYSDAEKIARYIEARAEEFKKNMINDLKQFSTQKPT